MGILSVLPQVEENRSQLFTIEENPPLENP
jgi:hypothetical protein